MPSCLPGEWPVWYNSGELRTLALRAQPHDARYDGLWPLRHTAWQPLRTEGGAAAARRRRRPDLRVLTFIARLRRSLRGYSSNGVIIQLRGQCQPSALAAFLSAVGVRNSELAQRLADVIAAQCEGAHSWAELARAREVATW